MFVVPRKYVTVKPAAPDAVPFTFSEDRTAASFWIFR
jgi:hypothetical protein